MKGEGRHEGGLTATAARTVAAASAGEPPLLPHHRALLEASAISPDVAAERGYFSATSELELQRLGFAPSQRRAPALILPVWNTAGRVAFHQIRPDVPRANEKGRPVKYETPAGVRMVLDVPPRLRPHLGDPSRELWITEGLRKVDSLLSAGLDAIGLLGVWNWRGRNAHGASTALGDWEAIALEERLLRLVFDSDVARKPEVRRALERLWAFLESRGATLSMVGLPERLGELEKVGVDDYLASGATTGELRGLCSSELPASGLAARIELVDLAALLEREPEPPRWNWHGRIEAGTLTLLHGDGGLGKSLLGFALVREAVRRGELLGWPVQASRALYIDAENPQAVIHRRAWQLGLRAADVERIAYYSVRDRVLADDAKSEDELVDVIEVQRADFVLLDSQRALWRGDEREANEVRALYSMLRRVAERTGAAIVAIHHDNRAGGYSGSSDLNAAVDSRLHIRRPKDWDAKKDDESDTGRTLLHEKARGGPIQPALDFDLAWSDATGRLELTLRDVGQSAVGRLSRKAADAAAFVREHGRVTTGEIAAAIGVSGRSVRRWRDMLASVGIDSDGSGNFWPREDPAEGGHSGGQDTTDNVRPSSCPPDSGSTMRVGGEADTSGHDPLSAQKSAHLQRTWADSPTERASAWAGEPSPNGADAGATDEEEALAERAREALLEHEETET